MSFWESIDALNRWSYWLTVAAIVSPFAFGLAGLVLQNRAKNLEDARLESLRNANASLTHDLAESKSQLSELKIKTGPWRLTDSQRGLLLASLSKVRSSPVLVICRMLDGESCDMANDLVSALKDSGWAVTGPGANSLNSFLGINVFSNSAVGPLPGAGELLVALKQVGLPTLSELIAAGSIGGSVPEGTICVIVGRRPT